MIKSLYVPSSCLQNDEFPAHILWDKSKTVEVTIKHSDSIIIEQIYNVPEGGIKNLSNSLICIDKFELNGYLGLVLKSKIYDEALINTPIIFEVKDNNNSEIQSCTKNISLFRPKLELNKSPTHINISYNKVTHKYELSDKICIKNIGYGTAIIAIELFDDGDFERSMPDGMQDFIERFRKDLDINLNELKESFVDYSDIIDRFLQFTKLPIALDEQTQLIIKDLSSDLVKRFEENEDFSDKFSTAIYHSYIKNIELITELTAFIEYLNSIGKGRIVILNSIDTICCKKQNGTLKLKIIMTDLGNNINSSLDIPPISVTSKTDLKIPIHLIFEWNGKGVDN